MDSHDTVMFAKVKEMKDGNAFLSFVQEIYVTSETTWIIVSIAKWLEHLLSEDDRNNGSMWMNQWSCVTKKKLIAFET